MAASHPTSLAASPGSGLGQRNGHGKRGLIRFATFLAPNMLPVYRFIAGYIGRALALPTELFVGSSYDELHSGAEVGFLCGLPYIRLPYSRVTGVVPLAASVLKGERYGGRPIYFSDVIVRRESPFRSFGEMRSCSWAYNEPSSHSGYGVVRYHLVRLGETGGYFSRVVEAGFHEVSIRMVCAGTVDASAIDSQVLAVALRDDPQLAGRLRIIDSFGPSTIQPVVASRRLPRSLRLEMQAVLLEMSNDPRAAEIIAQGFVERFVAVTDSSYDDIRAMLAAAQAANFLVLK